VPLFDTNSVPCINHWLNDLLKTASESDCRRQHNQQKDTQRGRIIVRRPFLAPTSIARLKTAAPSTSSRQNARGVSPYSLIDALKNSTTGKDQIIQRRIGARTEPDEISKESRKVERNSGPEE
jgi:hypothetical protein